MGTEVHRYKEDTDFWGLRLVEYIDSVSNSSNRYKKLTNTKQDIDYRGHRDIGT